MSTSSLSFIYYLPQIPTFLLALESMQYSFPPVAGYKVEIYLCISQENKFLRSR